MTICGSARGRVRRSVPRPTWWLGRPKPSASPARAAAALDIVAPAGLKAGRLIVIGTGKAAERKSQELVKLGGAAMGRVPSAASEATVLLELADGPLKPDAAADFALGARLRAYAFDRYKTKRKEGDEQPAKASSRSASPTPAGAARPGTTASPSRTA